MTQPEPPNDSPSVATRTLEVLLVEDSPADQQLTKIGLGRADVSTSLHIVDSGEDALRFLRREGPWAEAPTPDVVLLDLNLPGMAGHGVLSEIRNEPALADLAVVVLTTSDAAPDIAQAYDGLANAYMTKPVDFSQFGRVVGDLANELFTVVRLPAPSVPSSGNSSTAPTSPSVATS